MSQHKDWPHAPLHRLDSNGIYMVTASTLDKRHFFRTPNKLDLLENDLLSLAKKYQWTLEAWAVFSNHYHFIARNQPGSGALNKFLGNLHTATATEVNEMDEAPGRRVWFNFWDTKLTYERSYLARLSYVHRNAVKHGLVHVPAQYPIQIHTLKDSLAKFARPSYSSVVYADLVANFQEVPRCRFFKNSANWWRAGGEKKTTARSFSQNLQPQL